jgi:3-dehydroquinate synthase
MLDLDKEEGLMIGDTKALIAYLKKVIPVDSSSVFVLTDENTTKHCFPKLKKFFETFEPFDLIEIEAGELSKSLLVSERIWKTLKDCNADRKSILINLGGGVVTDLGGFIASTYMRGIRFIHLPTSLLAMVDAASGGKNGIDFEGAKNLIGTINPPLAVASNIDFIETLPLREVLCGWSEMLKHALIADKNHFEELIGINDFKKVNWKDLINHNAAIKNDIVGQDVYENGMRKKLNFGHTVGHAIEAVFLEKKEKYHITHGEAVAAGMIIASELSVSHAHLSKMEFKTIERTIDRLFERIEINKTDCKKIIDRLRFDKKVVAGKNRMVLLNEIGNAVFDIEVDSKIIEKAIMNYARLS